MGKPNYKYLILISYWSDIIQNATGGAWQEFDEEYNVSAVETTAGKVYNLVKLNQHSGSYFIINDHESLVKFCIMYGHVKFKIVAFEND